MPRYTVSIPASVIITVEAESEEALREGDLLIDAVFAEYGKYQELDNRTLGYDNFTVLEEEA